MSQINYEAEVRKVYPDARCMSENYSRYGIYTFSKRIDGWSCLKEFTAWKSCYNQLVRQNKIIK